MSSQVSLSFTLETTRAIRFMVGANDQGMDPEEYLEFLMDKAAPQNSTRTITEVCAEAVAETRNLRAGATFILDDVSPNYREVLCVIDRQQLGKHFHKHVKQAKLATFSHRNGQNQSVYIRD